MPNELAISNEEILNLTGESQQQGGASAIKYLKLVQEIKNSAAERFSADIAKEKDPVKKKELQDKMLVEMEKEIPIGAFCYKDGQDEFGLDIFKNLGNPFIVQILKIRYGWATKYGNAKPMYTSEVDSVKNMVSILEDKKEIDCLPGEMIKAKYPDLKRHDILYLYDKDTSELWKLSVRGGSLSPWFAYCQTFPKTVSKSSFETVIGSAPTTDPTTGKVYQAMTFARGSQITDTALTVKLLRELNMILGTTHISKPQAGFMTPTEAVAALNAPTITAATPDPILEDFKSAGEVAAEQASMGLKEKGKSIMAASARLKAKHDDKPEQEPPDFLK